MINVFWLILRLLGPARAPPGLRGRQGVRVQDVGGVLAGEASVGILFQFHPLAENVGRRPRNGRETCVYRVLPRRAYEPVLAVRGEQH